MSVNVDQVIAAYMKLRNDKAAIEAETKDRLKDIKAKMEKFEAWIKTQADAQGVTSFKIEGRLKDRGNQTVFLQSRQARQLS